MIKIIPADQFKTIPWKNGKGQTTELAISEDGTMDDFDWRLSIASVVEDGPFSDFTGYERNLILLEGSGIKLIHDEKQVDLLDKPLSLSSFNGASQTVGKLINGPITDFNLMTRQEKYTVDIKNYTEQVDIQIETTHLCFVYSHQAKMVICSDSKKLEVPIGCLTVIRNESKVEINGVGFILIKLSKENLLNLEI
jgi:hypothetical protein